MNEAMKVFPRWRLLWIGFICGFHTFREAWAAWRMIWVDDSIHRGMLLWCKLSPYAPVWDFSPWSIHAYLTFVQTATTDTDDLWVDAASVDPICLMPSSAE